MPDFVSRNLADNWPRQALRAAFAWYLVMVGFHWKIFIDPHLLLQSLGLSVIVGTLLTANAADSGANKQKLASGQILRFYLIPFCVASFSAVTGPVDFVVVFSPFWLENAVAVLAMLGILLWPNRKNERASPS